MAALSSLALMGCAKDEPTVDAAAQTSTSTTAVAVNSGALVEITSVAGKFGFSPDATSVKAGETVTWRNIDTTKHTVAADKDLMSDKGTPVDFKSSTMAADTEFVQTFAEPGTYTYYCSIHGRDKMSGTITVT